SDALGSSGVGPAVGAQALTELALLSQLRHAKRTKRSCVAAGCELAEDAVPDTPLALDDEVDEIVREEGVVAGRRIHHQLGRLVPCDCDPIAARARLRKRHLHRSGW